MSLSRATFAVLFFSCALPAFADELILPADEFARLGYRPVPASPRRELRTPSFGAHSLRWPVAFEDERHIIGNVMTQFQDYGGGAYFHGGDDLRVKRREWVFAPIGGKLEAGHYGYVRNPNGSLTKQWKPWPQQGNSMYFEVAIIDDDGYRFELHHVDRGTLPAEIIAILRAGGGRVAAGARLGQVVLWPNADTDETLYHHTHYNIVGPDGVNLNPERYSQELGDRIAPVINEVYAAGATDSGVARPLRDGRLTERPAELVIDAYDRINECVYKNTPAYARLAFESGEVVTLDFREQLSLGDARFPPIWEVFRQELRVEGGRTLRTEGNYSNRSFLLRLSVPPSAHGRFRVEVGDAAGNISTRDGELQDH